MTDPELLVPVNAIGDEDTPWAVGASMAERSGRQHTAAGGYVFYTSDDERRRIAPGGMAMAAEAQNLLTEEEYLRLEREGDIRHEYLNGEIFAMVGASWEHNAIVTSTSFALYGQLRRRPCNLFANDMRVNVAANGLYTYPDLVVCCGAPKFSDDRFDTLLNPLVIIEILSPSTEGYDRGKKFQLYQQLPSLKEYLLIAQEPYHVDHFVRQNERNWLLTAHDGPDATIHLPAIDCTLALADIYEKVNLPT